MNNSSENLKTFKTRRELLREKVNNLVNYCINLKPEKTNELNNIKLYSDEDIIYWIINEILPFQNNLNIFIDNYLKCYDITPNEEIVNKLTRYCKFFIAFMNK